MLITDPYFYLIAIPVVLLAGISKTGIPGLFGGMAVPLLALVISPLQAVAIMLPILCCIDLFGLGAFRGYTIGAICRSFLPGSPSALLWAA